MRSTLGATFYALTILGLTSITLDSCATGSEAATVADGGTRSDGGTDGPAAGCGSKDQPCCTDNECNTGTFCNMGTCRIQEPPDFGKACSGPADCMSGVCAALDLDGGSMKGGGLVASSTVCSTDCTSTSQCPAGWICPPAQAVGQSSVCICTPQVEMCDGMDNNCDGKVDEEPEADEACTELNGVPEKCVSGVCACVNACNSNCVDLATDPANCGKCNVTCNTPEETCTNGACLCATETCSGRCVDTTTDPENCGGCGMTCGTTCANSTCMPIQLATSLMVGGLGIAADGTNVYWFDGDPFVGSMMIDECANAGCNSMPATIAMNVNPAAAQGGFGAGNLLVVGGTNLYWPNDSKIQGAPLAMPMMVRSYHQGANGSPYQAVTDATNVYWTDVSASVIYKCALGTTCVNPTVLVNLGGLPIPADGGTDGGSPDGGPSFLPPESLAVDATFIYWTDSNGSIFSKPLAGGSVVTLVDETLIATAGGFFSSGMIVAAAGNVYWASVGNGGGIFFCPARGPCPVDDDAGLPNPGNIYWTSPTANSFSLATDGTNLYWTNQGPQPAIFKCALGSTTCATTATTLVALSPMNASPGYIAVDATYTYWLDNESGDVFEFGK